ncbi:MAG: RNA polymerase sigma-70 factor [Sphingobacteriaceae bacterium]
MSEENEALVAKLIDGDKQAFEWLFNCYYAKLAFFANRFLNDINIAEEITGEMFFKLWEKHEQLVITSSVSAFLYTMTKNKCLNYLKHQKIENLYLNYLQKNNLLETCAADTEKCYNDKELALQIKAAVERLPEKCRQVFMMSRYEDLKYRDIAVRLDISSKTVERHMGIALERLRKILKNVSYP